MNTTVIARSLLLLMLILFFLSGVAFGEEGSTNFSIKAVPNLSCRTFLEKLRFPFRILGEWTSPGAKGEIRQQLIPIIREARERGLFLGATAHTFIDFILSPNELEQSIQKDDGVLYHVSHWYFIDPFKQLESEQSSVERATQNLDDIKERIKSAESLRATVKIPEASEYSEIIRQALSTDGWIYTGYNEWYSPQRFLNQVRENANAFKTVSGEPIKLTVRNPKVLEDLAIGELYRAQKSRDKLIKQITEQFKWENRHH